MTTGDLISSPKPFEFTAAGILIFNKEIRLNGEAIETLTVERHNCALFYRVDRSTSTPTASPAATSATSTFNMDFPRETNNWSHIGDNPGEKFEYGQHEGKPFTDFKDGKTDVAYYCSRKLANSRYRKIHGLPYIPHDDLVAMGKVFPIKLSEDYSTKGFEVMNDLPL